MSIRFSILSTLALAMTLTLAVGCGSDDEDNGAGGTAGAGGAAGMGGAGGMAEELTVESICASYIALEEAVGCPATPIEDCSVPNGCLAEAAALVACFAANPSGCYCEMADDDRDMNCEGTIKDDEGPAELVRPVLKPIRL